MFMRDINILTQLPIVANLYIALALPTSHVETVALLSRETYRHAKDYIKVGIDAEEYYKLKNGNE